MPVPVPAPPRAPPQRPGSPGALPAVEGGPSCPKPASRPRCGSGGSGPTPDPVPSPRPPRRLSGGSLASSARLTCPRPPSTPREYEHDSDSEAPGPTAALLLPNGNGEWPAELRNFSIAYSGCTFSGWVRQRSPACAACACAGAWNAVAGVPSGSPGAQTQDSATKVLLPMLEARRRRRQLHVRKRLGVDVSCVVPTVAGMLAQRGRSLGGVGSNAVRPERCMRLLRQAAGARLVSEAAEVPCRATIAWRAVSYAFGLSQHSERVRSERRRKSQQQQQQQQQHRFAKVSVMRRPASASSVPRSAASAPGAADAESSDESFSDAESSGASAAGESSGASSSSSLSSDDDSAEDDAGAPQRFAARPAAGAPAIPVRDADGPGAAERLRGVAARTALHQLQSLPVPSRAQAKRQQLALRGLFRSEISVARLGAELASTSGVGNCHVTRCLARLCPSLPLHAELLLSARSAARHKISAGDDENAINAQWAALLSAMGTPNCALLAHLPNHYALVFALRSWQDSQGVQQRQLLTARKGQRPTAWIDFEEIRTRFAGSSRYAVYLVTNRAAVPRPRRLLSAVPLRRRSSSCPHVAHKPAPSNDAPPARGTAAGKGILWQPRAARVPRRVSGPLSAAESASN
eukprot:TRINITY_DN6820_c0_g1_i1.p1 TRINITY_DN6820_c0_g1~~TRINITY_DN6820_c0_g1_i1.p1  ORF type:complete len:635 (+),score=182.38 TRINITY_DN6820_c0_g1_i1:76-1980(+)